MPPQFRRATAQVFVSPKQILEFTCHCASGLVSGLGDYRRPTVISAAAVRAIAM
jgi:hypothetical protein